MVCHRLGEIEHWTCRECSRDRRDNKSAVTDALRTTSSLTACEVMQSAYRLQCHTLCRAAGTLRVETTTATGDRGSQTCRHLLVWGRRIKRACDPRGIWCPSP